MLLCQVLPQGRFSPEVTSFQSSAANAAAERDNFVPYASKSVLQRLSRRWKAFYGRLNLSPYVRDVFSLSLFSVYAQAN